MYHFCESASCWGSSPDMPPSPFCNHRHDSQPTTTRAQLLRNCHKPPVPDEFAHFARKTSDRTRDVDVRVECFRGNVLLEATPAPVRIWTGWDRLQLEKIAPSSCRPSAVCRHTYVVRMYDATIGRVATFVLGCCNVTH